jgi:hypothetical protein
MQGFKEAVTATLGFVLVVSTIILAYRAFGRAGQEEQMRDAMGILTLLFGLAGVVVGYYFGRFPPMPTPPRHVIKWARRRGRRESP